MPLYYDLGEMKSETGEVLRYEVEATASDLAIKLTELIQDYPVYLEILEKTGNPKTSLYFQKAIKSEIYSAVRDLCVLRWHQRNNVKIENGNDFVAVPSAGIFRLLDRVWPDETVSLRFIDLSISHHFECFYRGFRSFLRKAIDGFWAICWRWKHAETFRNFSIKKGIIALQFVEGVDINRRSDIVWYPKSNIDPERILIYFARSNHEPVDENIIKAIEEMGMRLVCLNKGVSRSKNAPLWYPPINSRKKVADLDHKPKDEIEKWICKTGKNLFDEVNYWSAFYRAFNVKIHFIIGGGDLKYIAQSIAFDLNSSKGGLLVGKQRSELYWPSLSILGSYPLDVFFAWAPRAEQYLSPNVNQIITSVCTGYPNDIVFHHKRTDATKLRDLLRSTGTDYIIALFDNVHGPDIGYSTATMEKFYLAFLTWLLEDHTVGILIKSKKSLVLQNLPSVLPILSKAGATGRCILLGDEFGRLPVDASLASDISVGIGISSAVIESAIAGCRSIHCDLTHLRSHEFYQWGYERIIFNDLDHLITAMKRHKSDRRSCPELGDWTPFLDRLDPFRDGRAGERMGTYLRWCLEGFDDGLDRDEAIRYANKKYTSIWGNDNVTIFARNVDGGGWA